MKYLILFLSLFLLSCAKASKETTDSYELPPELSDCKIFNLKASGALYHVTVVRCPLSITTTQYQKGKIKSSVTVLEL